MERIGKIVFFVTLFVAVAMKVYAKPTLSLSSATGEIGGTTTLEVSISGDTGTYAGMNARIILPDGVSVTDVTAGGGLPSSGFTVDYKVSTSNEVSIIAYSSSETFKGNSGELISLELKIAETASKGTYDVKFATSDTNSLINSKHAISNADGSASVSHATKDGTITIMSSSGTPTPIPTTTPAVTTTITTTTTTSTTTTSNSTTTTSTTTTTQSSGGGGGGVTPTTTSSTTSTTVPTTTTSTTTMSTSTTTTTLPSPPPTPSPTVTVKPTPTPPICELTSMMVSKSALKLKSKKSYEVTVSLTGDNDCTVESEEITVKINKAGKKCITILPESEITGSSGNALFTIKAKKVSGRAKVTFKAGSMQKVLIVKVKK